MIAARARVASRRPKSPEYQQASAYELRAVMAGTMKTRKSDGSVAICNVTLPAYSRVVAAAWPHAINEPVIRSFWKPLGIYL